jgi:putative transcriptional regulator
MGGELMKRDKLRELRSAKGKRSEIATDLGISVIHLRKLENGDVKPSAGLMIRMCKFLESKPEELFPDVANVSV